MVPAWWGKDLANESITTSIEEVIRLNASAVGMSVFIGSDYEHQTLLNLGKLVDEAERYGIPVMAVTAVGGNGKARRPLPRPLLPHCSRIGRQSRKDILVREF